MEKNSNGDAVGTLALVTAVTAVSERHLAVVSKTKFALNVLDVGGCCLGVAGIAVGSAARRVGEVVALRDVEDVAAGGFGDGEGVRRRPEFVAAEEDAPGQGVAHDQQRRGDQYEHYADHGHHHLFKTDKTTSY